MSNRQSTIQYEKLNPMPESIKYSIDIPLKFDLVMYFEFSLNKIEYDLKVLLKAKNSSIVIDLGQISLKLLLDNVI
jgi:hypothetical protein